MPKLNPISSRKLMRVITRLGFRLIRTKGSHYFFSHLDGRTTTIPVHGNEDIGIGLLAEILEDIELSVGEYEKLR
ncbi:MAG: type II toxin-antitoxin system HicA family toxin [Candidatus Paceibacterota bacterium]|jgi:predicted RNA binding protein YcfA (HicA-like mRNA interferase family)